ncbi:MAG: S9 family peptidase, partial [Neisseriaceae bacterium]|nr:S9 family peptidase [Neisseriaceae bacterium]
LSPLNRLQSNIHYPPIWITANWNDDRVSPAHALKLHAKLQEIQATSYLYMEDIGGHENQSNPSRQAEQLSAVFSFLYEIVNKNIAKPN